MKKLLGCILLLLLSTSAIPASLFYDFVSPNSGTAVHVVLLDTPCVSPMVKALIQVGIDMGALPKGIAKKFQAGEATLKTQAGEVSKVAFCWTAAENISPDGKGSIFLLDENQNAGALPMDNFAPIKVRKDYL